MSEPSLKQKTISGMIWVGVQRIGTLAISFLSNIFLARLLSPTDYGMIGMLAIFIAVSRSFIDGGFGSALIQKTRPSQEDYSTVFYWNIFLSVVCYIVLYFSAPYVEEFYKDIAGLANVLRVQGIVLIINAFSIVQFNKLRKQMRFKLLTRINIASAVIAVVVAIILALLGFGVWALVFSQICQGISDSVLIWIASRWMPSKIFSVKSFKELFGFGSFLLLSSFLNTFFVNIKGLIIGKFFSASTLGYFTQGKKLEDLTSLGVMSVIEQVSYPMLVEVKDDYKKMSHVLARFNSAILAITMPLLFALCITAEPVIVFLYSEKWLPSVPILKILCIYGIFIVMQGCNYNVIAAIGKSKVIFKWTIYKRVFNISVMVGLMFLFGFYGLLWGVVSGGMIVALCNMYLCDKYIGYKFSQQVKDLIPVIVLTSVPYAVIMIIVEYFLPQHNLVYVTISGILYLLIYILIMWNFPMKHVREIKLQMIDIYKSKFGKKNK